MTLQWFNRIPFYTIALWSLIAFWASLTFSSALMSITFVIALISWAIWKIQARDFKLSIPRAILLPLAAYLLICAASLLWSDFPKQSFKGVNKVLEQVLLFIMTAEIFASAKSLRRFEYGFIAVLTVLVINGYYQYTFGVDLIRHVVAQDSSAGSRISASFKTYGLLGSFLLLTLPLLSMLGLRFRNKDHKMLAWYFALPVSFGGFFMLFLTRSRGAILACIAGILVMMIYRKKFLQLFLALAVFAGIIMILPSSMVIHLDTERKEQSIIERFYLWDRAVQVIQAKPLLGTGINTYTVSHALYDKRKNWRVKNYYAHNGYLQMAAEIGLVGLTCFLSFILAVFILGYQHQRKLANLEDRNVLLGFMGGLLNFLIFAMVDTVMHNPQSILSFWFLLGIYYAYQKQTPVPNTINSSNSK